MSIRRRQRSTLGEFERLVAGGRHDRRRPRPREPSPTATSLRFNQRRAQRSVRRIRGSVVPHDVDIVLVVDQGFELEAKNRLAGIGFDRVIGVPPAPTRGDGRSPRRVQPALTVDGSRVRPHPAGNRRIPTGRHPQSRRSSQLEVIPGAIAIPVGQLPGRIDELDSSAPTVVYCAGGYRSSVAASLLRQAGFDDVSDILGGYGAWIETVAAPA